MSKLAEFYDPVGPFECYKLQLKLNLSKLNIHDWDDIISDDKQLHWKKTLSMFVKFAKIKIPRCAIPPDTQSNSHISLICVSDTAKFPGGAAAMLGED